MDATTIRIARFDANGERQGSMYDLQAPVKGRERLEPFWITVGDDVGLIWADGSILTFCAGCVPNHSLTFVVLDGQTLSPQSNVVALLNTTFLSAYSMTGGFLSPVLARSGDDLVLVSTVTYHVSQELGSATIRCTK